MEESRFIDVQGGELTGKRYERRRFIAFDEGGDIIIVRAYVAADGSVIDRDGGRPTVEVIKRQLNVATMKMVP